MTAVAQPMSTDRMQLLDAARLVAAVGVVTSHIMTELYPGDPLWIIGSVSVPFYLFVALYFNVRGFKKDSSRTVGWYLIGRIAKLYVPFLVWNVAYEVMHLVKYPDDEITSPKVILWAGMYAHLYFLPLLMIATTIVTLLIRPILASPAFRIAMTAVLLGIAAYCTWGPQLPPLPLDASPQTQTLWHIHRTIPPACFGMIFAIWMGTRLRRFSVGPKAGLLGIALMMIALAYQIIQQPHPMMRSLSGFGLVLIAFTPFYSPWLKPMAWIGRFSYGIYLSHVAFIRIALTAANYFDLPYNDLLAIGVGVFSLVCGTILTMILAQFRFTAWVVGCDYDTHHKLKAKPVAGEPLQTARLQMSDRPEHAPH